MSKKISVIIPVYNTAQYLARCLRSVLEQDCVYEVIAVNDGSTDRSADILAAFSAEYPTKMKVLTQENQGVVAARAAGIAAASGDYLGFVDSDDEVTSDFYSVLFDMVQKYHADVAHCAYQKVYPDHTNIWHLPSKDGVYSREEAVKAQLSGVFDPSLCLKLFAKHLFTNIQIPQDIRINEDYLLCIKLLAHADKVVYCDVPNYIYYVHATSSSNHLPRVESVRDMFAVSAHVNGFIEKHVPTLTGVALQKQVFTCIHCYDTLIIAKQKDLELEKEILKTLQKTKKLHFSLSLSLRRFLILHLPAIYRWIYSRYYRKKYKHRETA